MTRRDWSRNDILLRAGPHLTMLRHPFETVAVLAANHPQPEALRADLLASCRRDLARYKCPRDLLFIDFDELPRSTSGKIVRQDVETWLVRSGQVQFAS